MYEVFFNDRKIVIASKGEITLNKPVNPIENIATKEEMKDWFSEFIRTDFKQVVLIHNSCEYFFIHVFKPAFKLLPAAGGVVTRDNKLLFIFRDNKWDLPKGKIDVGETPGQAAIREVGEECGISGHTIIKQLPSSFHIYKSPQKTAKNEWIFKETFWFEMEYSGRDDGTPQTGENITKIKWFAKEDMKLPLANTYSNLKSLILHYAKN